MRNDEEVIDLAIINASWCVQQYCCWA